MSNLTTIIREAAPLSTVLAVGQGPSGPPGAGVSNTLSAVQALGGHRAVVSAGEHGADYADAYNPAHVGRVIGVTTGAASQDSEVSVQSFGPLEELSWSWVAGEDIFLGANGLLTQVLPPEVAFMQRVGQALTPTRMWVDISEPILF